MFMMESLIEQIITVVVRFITSLLQLDFEMVFYTLLRFVYLLLELAQQIIMMIASLF